MPTGATRQQGLTDPALRGFQSARAAFPWRAVGTSA